MSKKTIFFVKFYRFPFLEKLSFSEGIILSILFEKSKQVFEQNQAAPELEFTREKLQKIIPAEISEASVRSACKKLRQKKLIRIKPGNGRGHGSRFIINLELIKKYMEESQK